MLKLSLGGEVALDLESPSVEMAVVIDGAACFRPPRSSPVEGDGSPFDARAPSAIHGLREPSGREDEDRHPAPGGAAEEGAHLEVGGCEARDPLALAVAVRHISR